METKKLLSKKIGYTLFGFTGFLCAFFWKAERDLAASGNILWTGGYLFGILAFSVIAGGLAGSLLCFLLYGAAEGKWAAVKGRVFSGLNGTDKVIDPDKGNVPKERTKPQNPVYPERAKKGKREEQKAFINRKQGRGWKIFLISLFLILLCWIPCFLAYYPAVCAYDTTIQTGQIADRSYNDHHPIAHTLLLQGAMELGEAAFGSVNTGVGIYTGLQMLFLAGSFAYGIVLTGRLGVKKGWRLLLLLYAMLYPFHWFMGVSVIKDTVFAAFFLLQMLSLCALLSEGVEKGFIGFHGILFLISTVGMLLFRNNGKYAMLVLLVFLLLAVCFGKKQRKLWLRLFSYTFVGFLAGNILLSVLFSVTGAEQGDKREMLSMPIQQMARSMIYHGGVGVLPEDDNTMGEEAKALINDFLLDESYREYRPDISDPVKCHTNTYVPRYRAKEFVKTYLNLFVQYPGDYVNAALAVNAGYLSPGDVSHAHINENGTETGLGYVQTRWVESELNPRGIYKDSKWESLHQILEKWADDNAYLKLPVIKYLFVPGTFLWCYLFLACGLLVHRRFRMLLPLSLVLGYYITLFLGPTVQMRYLYPVMIALPFMALCGFANKQKFYPGRMSRF